MLTFILFVVRNLLITVHEQRNQSKGQYMNSRFSIVITDKNRNVRNLLRREFIAEGYDVLVAENGIELCGFILSDHTIDLMILDPNIPYVNYVFINQYIQKKRPGVPIIMHVFTNDETMNMTISNIKAIIEKKPDLKNLKKTVATILSSMKKSLAEENKT